MSDPHEDDAHYSDDYCGNCGGEGFTYDCIDGLCEYPEEGCEICARRCDWCNPPKPKKQDDGLRQILADALTKAGSA